MTDIHSHILPYVDDGSANLEMSFEMLRQAERAGTTGIVLTPHVNLFGDMSNLAPELIEIYESFVKKVKAEKINIDLYFGGEIFANEHVLELAERRLLPTINNSRFMLIEFDFYADLSYMLGIISALSGMQYVPIVAHPERYMAIKSNVLNAWEMLQCGALLQTNKGSLLGDFGTDTRAAAMELTARKLNQFVGSDCHENQFRTSEMDRAYTLVTAEFGNVTAKRLFEDNPQAVINDARLSLPRPNLDRIL